MMKHVMKLFRCSPHGIAPSNFWRFFLGFREKVSFPKY